MFKELERIGKKLTMEYKRLGDYIRLVDVRNRDLKVTNLVGLTIDKAFIPSVANVIGTDLSNYKVICQEQFACSLMQVSRDGKMPIAMFKDDKAIMSPAYPMFEVIDKKTLLPQYLMMWFSRSEFDREASFYAVGGVRGSLDWEDFMNMKIPVPSIEEQRRIVSEYQTVEQRIQNNEQLIKKLEDTAQAIYNHTFVEGIDEENLPKGWRKGMLSEIVTFKVGGDKPEIFSETISNECRYPIYSNGTENKGLYGYTNKPSITTNSITISARGNVGTCFLRRHPYSGIVRLVSVLPCQEELLYYLYFDLLSRNLQGDGSAQQQITVPQLENENIIIPSSNVLNKFHNQMEILFNNIDNIEKETQYLNSLLSLLTSKLS